MGMDERQHIIAQRYELYHQKIYIEEHIKNEILDIFKKTEQDKYYITPTFLEFFFKNDTEIWLNFARHIENKRCLEIGSGPNGASIQWLFVREWIIIDPLIDEYKKLLVESGSIVSWPANIKTYAQNAENIIAELKGKIDGVIVCKNCLDHAGSHLEILRAISEYAVKGCKLLLWTDLYHLLGHDEGHSNITANVDEFKHYIEALGFDVLYGTPRFREDRSTIEYGCVAVKSRESEPFPLSYKKGKSKFFVIFAALLVYYILKVKRKILKRKGYKSFFL